MVSLLRCRAKARSEELQNEPPAPNAVALHPAILKQYEKQLLQLEDAFGRSVNVGDAEAAEAIRDLVENRYSFSRPSAPRWRSRTDPVSACDPIWEPR